MSQAIVHSDEPTRVDRLQRSNYVEALADIARSCETPMVIGLYGRWGIGKTSLMRQIQEELDADDSVRTVWFDAWQHQFDEHPALGLLHTMVDTLGIKDTVKKILLTIGIALSASALRATQVVDPDDIQNTLESYEEEYFQMRDARARLYDEFEKLIGQAQKSATGGKPVRIAFFIDDLDRCQSSQIISVLDSIKLYLNLQGCVYFLALDRAVLEASIQQHYKDLDRDAIGYLDKIIQLPFTIPPIPPDCMKLFIKSLLPTELEECGEILERGLSPNPREIKRFINILLLNHSLASARTLDHRPVVLATLLLIQYRNPELYLKLAQKPSILKELFQETEVAQPLWETYLAGDEYLEHVLKMVQLPAPEELKPYIYLTDVAGIRTDAVLRDEQGFYTEEGLEQLLYESGMLAEDEFEVDKLLLFRTRRQRTWVIATNQHLFCLLDDERTRKSDRVIRWKQPLSKSTPVQARMTQKGRDVVDIGARKSWLYSRNLHPDHDELVKNLEKLIKDAQAME